MFRKTLCCLILLQSCFMLFGLDLTSDEDTRIFYEVTSIDPLVVECNEHEAIQRLREKNPEVWDIDYPLRLTNLRNVWSNIYNCNPDYGHFDGFFNDAADVAPDDYSRDWGHLGAESNKINVNEIGGCIYCDNGGYGIDTDLDIFQEQIFSYHKFIGGQDIEIEQPQFVDFAALGVLGRDYFIFISEEPCYPFGSGELRLFIPFVASPDSPVPDYLLINDKYEYMPISNHSSRNFPVDPGYRFDREIKDDIPGLCLVFLPISYCVPYDTTPLDDTKNEMSGAEMSSLRNRLMHLFARTGGFVETFVDWGYEGFYEAYLSELYKNVEVPLNPSCSRCEGSFKDLIGYNPRDILLLDCTELTAYDNPLEKHILNRMSRSEHVILINNEVMIGWGREDGFFRGQDTGYAALYVIKHMEVVEKKNLKNWSTGDFFDVVHAYPCDYRPDYIDGEGQFVAVGEPADSFDEARLAAVEAALKMAYLPGACNYPPEDVADYVRRVAPDAESLGMKFIEAVGDKDGNIIVRMDCNWDKVRAISFYYGL